jgi:hypothetical protein
VPQYPRDADAAAFPPADSSQQLISGGGSDASGVSPGPVSVRHPEAVIRSQIFPGAKQCYRQGLKSNGRQEGKLVLLLRLAPNGNVDVATVRVNTGLSDDVVDCIIEVARSAKFEPPSPNDSQISIPFNFVRAAPEGGVRDTPMPTSM